MKRLLAGLIGAAVLVAAGGGAQAQSISDVENARAKDRAGYYLNRQDRANLRRYGRNDGYGYRDHGYDGGYGYSRYGYGDRSYGDVSVYVGPGGYYDD